MLAKKLACGKESHCRGVIPCINTVETTVHMILVRRHFLHFDWFVT